MVVVAGRCCHCCCGCYCCCFCFCLLVAFGAAFVAVDDFVVDAGSVDAIVAGVGEYSCCCTSCCQP